jgi:hypothetical protein
MEQDLVRHCIDLAYTSGKKLQNPASGFVTQEAGVSLYDNLLFCLALFRTKTQENMAEAKKLLERLLFFQQRFPQVPWYGNFPLYLHDFPYCKEHLQAVRCLPPLLWISKGFAHILGEELQNSLHSSIEALLSFAKSIKEQLPGWAKIQLAACALAYGQSFEEPSISFDDLCLIGDPIALSGLISAFQLHPTANFNNLWEVLANSWHRVELQFVGPLYKLRSKEASLYDYYMGLFSGRLSKKAESLCPEALAAALVYPRHHLLEITYPVALKRERYFIKQEEAFALSCLGGHFASHELGGLYPFHLVSGGVSLVMQAPHCLITLEGDSHFFVDIPEELIGKEEVLSFWFDKNEKTELTVLGSKATCFSIDEPITIRLGNVSLSLSCSLVFGEGQLLWHQLLGNRWQSTKTMESTDRRLSLRAVRGKGPLKIKIKALITS